MRFGVRRRESPGIRRMPGSCAQRRRRTGAWWRGRGAGANRRHLQRNRAHGRDSPARGLSAGAVAGRAGSPSRRSGRGDAVRGARRGSTAPDRLTARRRESLGVRLGRACARTGSAARDRLAARWCGQGDRRSGAGCGEGDSALRGREFESGGGGGADAPFSPRALTPNPPIAATGRRSSMESLADCAQSRRLSEQSKPPPALRMRPDTG